MVPPSPQREGAGAGVGRTLLTVGGWISDEVVNCAFLDVFWRVGITVGRVMHRYYTVVFKAQTKAFVELNATADYVSPHDTRTASWSEWFEVDTVKRYWEQLRHGDVSGQSVVDAVSSALTCDYETITLCRVNRGLFRSAKLVAVLLLVLVVVIKFGTLKVVNLSLVAVVVFPTLTLLVAYDYSPTCVPMVPTCLTTDIVDVLLVFKPAEGGLYVSHLSRVWAENNLTLAKCSVAPYRFGTLLANFAFSNVEHPSSVYGNGTRSVLIRRLIPTYTRANTEDDLFRACNAVTFGRNLGHLVIAIAVAGAAVQFGLQIALAVGRVAQMFPTAATALRAMLEGGTPMNSADVAMLEETALARGAGSGGGFSWANAPFDGGGAKRRVV